ncbi:condensation domain-containing protein, partial [Azomonas macrocytogenes]
GFRIELGEIEARLQEQAVVREAVVIDLDGPSGKQLAGYLVPADPAILNEPQAQSELRAELKDHLKTALPDYMVPAHLILLERMPLTPNGKLDRRALPRPDVSLLQQEYIEPRSELERQLAGIWAEVLKVERIGLTDNFFELGGDSIISIQVVSRARQQGIQITPKDLFQHQTIQGLAGVARRSEGLRIEQGLVMGQSPLTPIQHFFFESAIPQRHHWNQSVLLKPTQPLDAGLLNSALSALLRQHDSLRLSFRQINSQWQAQYLDNVPVDVLWHSQLNDASEIEAVANEAQASLNLSEGPLLCAVLMQLADGSQRLLVAIHHLVVDGVSWRILLEDLQTAYAQLLTGHPIQLSAKTSSFKDWSEHLQAYAHSPVLEQELGYWQDQLQDVDDTLPYDHPDGRQQQKHAVSVSTQLNRDDTRRLLQEAPAAYRTQINDLLLTALARIICRWTGQSSTVIKLEGHGREDLFDDLDITRTVGWFTTAFPVKLSPQEGMTDSLKTIKEQLRAVPNKGIGYGLLRYLGSPEAQTSLQGLPQGSIVFNYLGQFDGSFDAEEGLFVPSRESGGAELDEAAPLDAAISINGQIYGGELNLSWTFSGEVFEQSSVQRLAEAYAQELQTLIAHCTAEGSSGVTPLDFPLAGLSQAQLDQLTANIPSAQISDIYPLSPMQQGMLF